jgi:hypothetical protein
MVLLSPQFECGWIEVVPMNLEVLRDDRTLPPHHCDVARSRNLIGQVVHGQRAEQTESRRRLPEGDRGKSCSDVVHFTWACIDPGSDLLVAAGLHEFVQSVLRQADLFEVGAPHDQRQRVDGHRPLPCQTNCLQTHPIC